MSVTCQLNIQASVSEVIETNAALLSDATIVHLQSYVKTLNASSTSPATKVASGTAALSGGAKTLDLTALPSKDNVAVDFTGLRIHAILIINPINNGLLTVAAGASNGFLFGTTNAKMSVLSDGFFAWGDNSDGGADVASGAKNIDVAGTGSQTFTYLIIGG